MLIAQISDTHITSPGTLLAGRLDSAERLREAVRCACRYAPDAVLLTGDLADRGEPAAYALLREILSPLSMPVYAIPGNHDRREPLRAAFADCDWMPPDSGSRLYYAVPLGPFTLIALDTLVEGEDYGLLGDQQLGWLDACLRSTDSEAVLVMLHHPPIESGIAVMDAMKLRDAEALGRIVSRHPHIERILCGHLHRSMHARWCNTTVSVPSSTVEQLQLDLGTEQPLATVQEPPALLLHYCGTNTRLVTHHVPIGSYPGPFF